MDAVSPVTAVRHLPPPVSPPPTALPRTHSYVFNYVVTPLLNLWESWGDDAHGKKACTLPGFALAIVAAAVEGLFRGWLAIVTWPFTSNDNRLAGFHASIEVITLCCRAFTLHLGTTTPAEPANMATTTPPTPTAREQELTAVEAARIAEFIANRQRNVQTLQRLAAEVVAESTTPRRQLQILNETDQEMRSLYAMVTLGPRGERLTLRVAQRESEEAILIVSPHNVQRRATLARTRVCPEISQQELEARRCLQIIMAHTRQLQIDTLTILEDVARRNSLYELTIPFAQLRTGVLWARRCADAEVPETQPPSPIDPQVVGVCLDLVLAVDDARESASNGNPLPASVEGPLALAERRRQIGFLFAVQQASTDLVCRLAPRANAVEFPPIAAECMLDRPAAIRRERDIMVERGRQIAQLSEDLPAGEGAGIGSILTQMQLLVEEIYQQLPVS